MNETITAAIHNANIPAALKSALDDACDLFSERDFLEIALVIKGYAETKAEKIVLEQKAIIRARILQDIFHLPEAVKPVCIDISTPKGQNKWHTIEQRQNHIGGGRNKTAATIEVWRLLPFLDTGTKWSRLQPLAEYSTTAQNEDGWHCAIGAFLIQLLHKYHCPRRLIKRMVHGCRLLIEQKIHEAESSLLWYELEQRREALAAFCSEQHIEEGRKCLESKAVQQLLSK